MHNGTGFGSLKERESELPLQGIEDCPLCALYTESLGRFVLDEQSFQAERILIFRATSFLNLNPRS